MRPQNRAYILFDPERARSVGLLTRYIGHTMQSIENSRTWGLVTVHCVPTARLSRGYLHIVVVHMQICRDQRPLTCTSAIIQMPTYTCLTSDIYLFLPQAIFALVSEDGGGAGRLVRVDLNDYLRTREKKEKKGSIPLTNCAQAHISRTQCL